MGEGRRDRSTKRNRQRTTYRLGKSSSDSELARGRSKDKERWPLAEGLTVDELARYRRRRVQDHPKDSLGLARPEEVIKGLISEYRRAFRASSDELFKNNAGPPRAKRPPDLLRLDGIFDTVTSYYDDFKEYKFEPPVIRRGPSPNLQIADGDKIMETETESSRFIPHQYPISRSPYVRRGTSLKREGDFHADTEYSCYVAHEGAHRPHLARRPTSLKMEGDMDTVSEKCEKFIEWMNVSRPELRRLPAHLKLEGELETTTECHENYVPFVGARRPELLRQGANLKMEGEARYVPEYSDVFKGYDVKESTPTRRPESHLKPAGDFRRSTETSERYVDPKVAADTQLMAELERDIAKEEAEREEEEEEVAVKHRAKEDEMKTLVSKLEDLRGPPLEIPEYREAYKDFPRERPRLVRPEDEIGRADGSKVSPSPTHSKFRTKIDMDPEYRSKFLDLTRERPVYRKPPVALRPANNSGRSSRTSSQRARRSEGELTSEVRSQYVSYGQVPRVEIVKMPANLRLEGSIDLEPEYRNAYCTKRDHPACVEPRMHRGRDRSLSAARRKDNYWLSNDNSEQFGRINASQDQDAFQVLNTRVHEESVIGKPPSGSTRASRSPPVRRPTDLEIADPSALRNRSPSPTYRLHVCNVDNEPRGFARRKRSPSLQGGPGSVRSSSPVDRANNPERPYSPSFARESRQKADDRAFVVLDNSVADQTFKADNYANEARRRRLDRNCNVDSQNPVPRGRTRSRTPSNWMPPWYDNASTI